MAVLTLSDKEYLDGLKLGNDAVIRSIYKKNYPAILRMVLNNNGTEPEAKDIFQESVIVLYQNALKEEFSLRCSLQTYLYSVAHKLWLKQLLKTRNLYRLNPENENQEKNILDVSQDMDFHFKQEENFEKLRESQNMLGEPCKSLLEDFYIAHLGMTEIADRYGYSNADTAKNQKYKCLQRLKKIFFMDHEGKVI